ncbi:MAG: S-layer family protein [Calothrix sp. SM1_7_51]|nr:S-layer family protein [Calothrix sp. SM1_7_51]
MPFKKARTELSDITASSEFGISGNVTINIPEVDSSRGLLELPSNLVDVSQQIVRGCTPKQGQTASRFISTGRGGLPLSPEQPLRGRAVITNWVALPEEKVTNREINQSPTSKTQSAEQIVEARRWIVDGKGNVIFVAQFPLGISSKNNYNLLDCAHTHHSKSLLK